MTGVNCKMTMTALLTLAAFPRLIPQRIGFIHHNFPRNLRLRIVTSQCGLGIVELILLLSQPDLG